MKCVHLRSVILPVLGFICNSVVSLLNNAFLEAAFDQSLSGVFLNNLWKQSQKF